MWLRDVYDYIAQDNPTAAAEVLSGIYDKAQMLADHPELGYRHELENGGPVRILLYGHYRIAYRIRSSGDIDILGVFHGAMQINRYLFSGGR